ncbi:MAG: pirin family protein [Gemmataceae bacterium]
MLQVRRSAERGHFDHGWLDTYHTFSFADFFDPEHMGFRSLRVMNEDRIAGGRGFGMHPHRDMEIVTYVLTGQLQHKDSLGNGAVLRAGELQRITAGRGILHSEFNPDSHEPVHLYQIWLLPRNRGLEPGYEQKKFDLAGRQGRLQLVADPDGQDGALRIQQDARLYLGDLQPGQELAHTLAQGRHAWLQVLRGEVQVGSHRIQAGDGVAFSQEPLVHLTAPAQAEVLLFDLN